MAQKKQNVSFCSTSTTKTPTHTLRLLPAEDCFNSLFLFFSSLSATYFFSCNCLGWPSRCFVTSLVFTLERFHTWQDFFRPSITCSFTWEKFPARSDLTIQNCISGFEMLMLQGLRKKLTKMTAACLLSWGAIPLSDSSPINILTTSVVSYISATFNLMSGWASWCLHHHESSY